MTPPVACLVIEDAALIPLLLGVSLIIFPGVPGQRVGIFVTGCALHGFGIQQGVSGPDGPVAEYFG